MIAMLLVGAVVTSLIEAAFTRNSATTSALYVDSVIAPILPDMRTNEVLDGAVMRALDETLGQGALGSRLASFRLWRRDGTILYSEQKDLIGKQFEPSEDLRAAFQGQLVAEYGPVDDVESEAERASGLPLLEIYNPIRQPWSGEVVAVSEFYEIAPDFQRSLSSARLLSWLAVACVTLGFFLVLSLVVFRGSRIIDEQRHTLKERVGELSELLAQNKSLNARVQRASQRVAALNEGYLRRIGADLHDGPAQLVALAALRLDSRALSESSAPAQERASEITAIKVTLEEALRELRSICSGLVLPYIEAAALGDILRLAVKAHEQRTNCEVGLSVLNPALPLSPSAKICIYRFIQEALNNGYRHAGGFGQRVSQAVEERHVIVEVSDEGQGFDLNAVGPERLGLAGLRERVESLGGSFMIRSSATGTLVRMSLSIDELEQT